MIRIQNNGPEEGGKPQHICDNGLGFSPNRKNGNVPESGEGRAAALRKT
jgi:hypothetical protein